MQTHSVAINDIEKKNVNNFGGKSKKCMDDLEEMGSPEPVKKTEPRTPGTDDKFIEDKGSIEMYELKSKSGVINFDELIEETGRGTMREMSTRR